MPSRRYCLITPCRDEADFARRTLESVTAQSVRPALWVLVDDGSTDETPAILAEYAARHAYIRTIRRPDRGERKVGGGVVDAFYAGYDTIDPGQFDYVCKLDLDLELPPRYFELLMQRMESNPRIGACSGKAYFPSVAARGAAVRFPLTDLGPFVSEKVSDDHALGMAKFYRTPCFLQIGGFVRELMWDGIDSHRCRQLGWIATSWDDPDLRFVHLRPMGTSHRNWWTGRVRHGFGQYFMGTSPVWMVAASVFRMSRPPLVVGGIAMLSGYFGSMVRGRPRYQEPGFRAFLRRYQWACLLKGRSRALRDLDARQARVWNPGAAAPAGEAEAKRSRPRARRIVLLALVNLVLLELAATAFLAVRPGIFRGLAVGPDRRDAVLVAGLRRVLENRPDSLAMHDPDLGWRPRAGLSLGLDQIEGRGLRSSREHAPVPLPSSLRIAAFGDSFVYGSEVATDEAWPNVLDRIRPDTEVLNYGVPGYGQDQIYLRFLAEGGDLAPRAVFFGVAAPTLDRVVTVLGAFRSLEAAEVAVMSKPRFLLDGNGELELVPNPFRRLADLEPYVARPAALRELGRHDFWYEPLVFDSWWYDHSRACRLLFAGWAQVKRRYLDPDRPFRGPPGGAVFNDASDGFRILTRILERSVGAARERGIEPVVLLLPDGFAIQRARDGRGDVMDPLRKLCRERGLPWLDAGEAFLALPAGTEWDSMFSRQFHYSAAGNRVVADWLRREIDRRGW